MFNLITFFIMCVGGLNWFCIGLFQFDIIAGIFGSQAHFISRFLYCIIGIATLISLIALPIKKGRIYMPKQKSSDEDTDPEEDDVENEEKSPSNEDNSPQNDTISPIDLAKEK